MYSNNFTEPLFPITPRIVCSPKRVSFCHFHVTWWNVVGPYLIDS